LKPIDLTAIHTIPVLLAVLASFFLGAVWYSALFKNAWQRLHGFTEEKMDAMKKVRPMPIFFGGIIAADMVTALGGAIFLQLTGVTSVGGGIFLGFLVWAGIATPIQFTNWLASDKPLGLYFIDTGFQLVRLPLMGAVLTIAS
jgi:hypothetical protein